MKWRWCPSFRGWIFTALLFSLIYISVHTTLLAQAQDEQSSTDHGDEHSDGAGEAFEEEVVQEEEHPVAFDYLPKTQLGYVDWVKAITEGVIDPKESLDPDYRPMPPLDFDVLFEIQGDMPDVVYPHYPHTIWLDCRNCHPAIFKMQAGTNPVTMEKILRGEFCGRCHGKVAFPISDCERCHSKKK